MSARDALALAHWRREVAQLHFTTAPDPLTAYRAGKDRLFRSHPQSPIPEPDRAAFNGLAYYPADPAWRLTARVEDHDNQEIVIATGGEDGDIRYRRTARLIFEIGGREHALTVLSLDAYGHGLFCPFTDATCGSETYGGGRYLFDTPKQPAALNLELTPGSDRITVDFNYAYNPSCAYSPAWACPLAPPENRLPIAVRAGERLSSPDG